MKPLAASLSGNDAHREEGYRCVRAGYGYYTFEVDSYDIFIRHVAPLFVSTRLPVGREGKPQEFVWRGMRDPSWTLQSSLSRFASGEVKSRDTAWQIAVCAMTIGHLIEFLNHMRGLGLLNRQHDELFFLLREKAQSPYSTFLSVLGEMTRAQVNLTHELFSLGQHHGMLTPFLDWTAVPLVALYFAFEGRDERENGVGFRVVFALNKTATETICPPLDVKGPEDILFLESMAHDNPRIVAQGGLFSFVPAHRPVDQWVVLRSSKESKALPSGTPVLIRFLIRNVNRSNCLNELAASGIHARTVFPDRFGAALHSNFRLETSPVLKEQRRNSYVEKKH